MVNRSDSSIFSIFLFDIDFYMLFEVGLFEESVYEVFQNIQFYRFELEVSSFDELDDFRGDNFEDDIVDRVGNMDWYGIFDM